MYVETERSGDLTVLRVNRPPANAIVLELATELARTFEHAVQSKARAILLTGIDDYFSAGVDLKVVPSYAADQQALMVSAINRLVATVYACPKPVVAAVSGHAIAGGLVLVLCCDYRVGADGPFRLGLTEAKAGVPFPAAAMEVTRRELQAPAARLLVLLNRTIDPDEALALGVLDELVPADRLRGRAMEIAREMADLPPQAFARTKRALHEEAIARMRSAIESQSDPALQEWLSPETASAAAAILAKAKPRRD